MNKPLYEFFTRDHRRVDKLLEKATEGFTVTNEEKYRQFRIGLLTHIKMEENILFPAVKEANGGKQLPMIDRFRREHGALTTIVAAKPDPEVIKVLRHVLEKHDEAEEEQGGMYEVCENLTGEQTREILEKAKSITEVPVHPPNPADAVLKAAKRVLKRAGYDYDEIANG